MSAYDVTQAYHHEEVFGKLLQSCQIFADSLGRGDDRLWALGYAEADSAPAAADEPNPAAQDRTAVFVRVRPLIEPELNAGVAPLQGMAMRSSDPGLDPAEVVAMNSDIACINGFDGVLGPEADNEEVFLRCFASRLDTVARGGTASLFCYGYTGSGKSHTVLGYGGEKGLYFLAAKELLERLQDQSEGGEEQFLVATVAEVYGDAVFDLLGDERQPAELRTDADGNLVVCGPAASAELSDQLSPQLNAQLSSGPHATTVSRTMGLRCAKVRRPEDLAEVGRSAVSHRITGASTTHEQSSRSHAVLRLEVFDAPTFDAREALEDARAEMPALKNAVDNHNNACYHGLVDSERMLSDHAEKTREAVAAGEFTHKYDPHEARVHLRQYPGGQEEWDAVYAGLLARKAALHEALQQAHERVLAAKARYDEVKSNRASPGLGGSLVLVDLAGADYDNRDVGAGHSAQQKRESADINKSLLALKECFRSLAGAPGAASRPPFRDSKLTRIMEDALRPTAQSRRTNRESVSVMLVNVSPAANLERMTTNALRYGQLFAGRSCSKPLAASSKKSAAVKPWLQKKAAAVKAKENLAAASNAVAGGDTASVLDELRSIYAEHCPDKSESEVQAIISKFAGREVELLAKAKAKYVVDVVAG